MITYKNLFIYIIFCFNGCFSKDLTKNEIININKMYKLQDKNLKFSNWTLAKVFNNMIIFIRKNKREGIFIIIHQLLNLFIQTVLYFFKENISIFKIYQYFNIDTMKNIALFSIVYVISFFIIMQIFQFKKISLSLKIYFYEIIIFILIILILEIYGSIYNPIINNKKMRSIE